VSESEESREYKRRAEEDLSKILQHITQYPFSTRKNKKKARELANSQATRQFLDAGLRLIAEQFAKAEQAGDGDEEASPFFAWLSQKRVVDEVHKTEEGKTVTAAEFRDRWKYQPYYIADLLAYSLWEQHWSLHISTAEESLELLTSSSDFVDAIHEVAYRDLCVLLDEPTYRISLIAAALAERNSPIAAAIHETYRVLGESRSET